MGKITKQNGFKMKKARIILTIITIISVLAIWGQSCIPAEGSEEESNIVKELIEEIVHTVSGQDSFHIPLKLVRKAAHFTEYAILGTEMTVLTALYLYGEDKKIKPDNRFIPMFGTLVTALVDESIQSFSNRYPSLFDVWLDFSGALFAIVVVNIILIAILKSKSRKVKE